MASSYFVTITHKDGESVHLVPNGQRERDIRKELLIRLSERNLRQEFLDNLASKGVGVLRTTNHVVQDAADAFSELDIFRRVGDILDAIMLEMKAEVLD